MGLFIHFYIIFGTNLLTGGPAQIAVFLPISVFCRKRISNGVQSNETLGSVIFGTNMIQRTWSGSQETSEAATRVPGVPPTVGRSPYPHGPLERPPTYFFLLYIYTYPKNIQEHHEKLFPPPQPSVSARSHLGAFDGALSEGESTTEGLYIISKASPMSCV